MSEHRYRGDCQNLRMRLSRTCDAPTRNPLVSNCEQGVTPAEVVGLFAACSNRINVGLLIQDERANLFW